MSGELHNIPPVWTAVFHWQSCLLYLSLLPRRWGRGRCAAAALALLAVQLPYMGMIAPQEGLAFNLGMAGFAGLTLLPFALIHKGDWRGRLYYCARAFILGGFTVSLAWQLYSYYRGRLGWLAPFWAEAAFMLAVGGAVYAARCGFCLETQFFPDTPNQPSFPSCVLRAGEDYNSRTVYRFGTLPDAGQL